MVLSTDDSKLSKGITSARKKAEKLNKVFKVVAGVSAALVGTFAVLAKKAIDNADKFEKMSQRVGVSTETLSRMEFAAELGGASIETVEKSMGKLARSVLEADDGMAEYVRTFDRLGISIRDGDGNLRQLDPILLEVADKFSQMEDGTEKTALAMDLFGKSGTELIPMLNEGRDGLAAMFEESDKLGRTIGTDTAQAAARFNDALLKLNSAFEGIINKIVASGLLDGLVLMAETLAELVLNSDDTALSMEGVGKALTFPIKMFFMIEEQVAKARVGFNKFLASAFELIVAADDMLGAWSPFNDLAGDLRGKIDQFNLSALHAGDEAKEWQKKQDKLNKSLKGMKKPAEVAKDRADKLARSMQVATTKTTAMTRATDLAKGIFNATNKIIKVGIDRYNVYEPAMGRVERRAATMSLVLADSLDISLADVARSTDDATLAAIGFGKAQAVARNTADELAKGVDILRSDSLDALGKSLEESEGDVTGWAGVWQNQVSTIVTDFSAGVADLIFDGKSLAQTMTGIFKEMGKTIVRGLIETLFNPVKEKLAGLLGGLIGGIGGGGGGGGIGGALGGIGKAAGGIGGSAGSLLTAGIGGAISGVVSGVIGAIFNNAKGKEVAFNTRLTLAWVKDWFPVFGSVQIAGVESTDRMGNTLLNLLTWAEFHGQKLENIDRNTASLNLNLTTKIKAEGTSSQAVVSAVQSSGRALAQEVERIIRLNIGGVRTAIQQAA